MSVPSPYRADIKKTAGRLVWVANPDGTLAAGASIFSKLNTAIERSLSHETFEVGTDAAGSLDLRDREFYARVRMTPDGRFKLANMASILWPDGTIAGMPNYRNPVISTPIFTPGTDRPLAIHGADASLEVFTSAALDTMPSLRFTATETAIGQAEWLCLRGDGQNWSAANSLVTQSDTGGTLADAAFNPFDIATGPYFATWTPNGSSLAAVGSPGTTSISPFDTLEGFTVEFQLQFSDDTRQSVGLSNRRIKSVSVRVRCSPVGATRQSILAAQMGQGAGAVRGRSLMQSNSGIFQIVDVNGSPMFTLNQAALTEDRQTWGTEQVRETDLVWVATRKVTAGVLQPLFSVLS